MFEGLFEFCQITAAGSIGVNCVGWFVYCLLICLFVCLFTASAVKLNKGNTDIAINWMGGLHHAKNRSDLDL